MIENEIPHIDNEKLKLEIEETEKQFNEMMSDDEDDDTNGFTDAADADDIFG